MKTINYMGIDIPLSCEQTYKFLAHGKNLKGIFQMETNSAAKTLIQVVPKNIEDLSLVNALNRPGCYKFTEAIGEIRRGNESVKYLHPSLEPFLKNTYGFLIYQESVLQIAQQLAGFSPIQSSVLLKALGKKLDDKMLSLKEAFIDGVKKSGLSDEVAHQIFSWFVDFANYSFNKSHSTAYSLQGYCSAYLKLHYPLAFFCSALNYTQYEQKPLEDMFDYASELPEFGLKLSPPSIDNISNRFIVKDGTIIYPIGLIKGLGEKYYKMLETLTPVQTQTFDSTIESLMNSGLNSRSIEAIIICGSLDKFGMSREDILLYYWFLSELQPEVLEKFWTYKNGHSFSIELIKGFLDYKTEEVINKKGKIRIKSYFKTEATREKNIKKFSEYCELHSQYKQNPVVAKYIWEMNTLGYASNYQLSKSIKTYQELDAMDLDTIGNSFGIVEEVMHRRSEKGNEYAIYVMKFDKRQSFMFFGHAYSAAKNVIQEGDYVTFTAKKETKGLAITSIKKVNHEVNKYEFYKKSNAA
jgi:DNA polymerase III alpha subunit